MSEGRVSGLVLAAGAARRFGRPNKLIAGLAGRPVLSYALETMRAAGLAEVICVLGADRDEVLRRVDFTGVRPLHCADWELGQSASLRAGVKALGHSDAVVITLGDQPRIASEAIKRVVASRSDAGAVQATYGGVPGHPVLLERSILNRVPLLVGDRGARGLLEDSAVEFVSCDALGSPADVDTPADLAEANRALGR